MKHSSLIGIFPVTENEQLELSLIEDGDQKRVGFALYNISKDIYLFDYSLEELRDIKTQLEKAIAAAENELS